MNISRREKILLLIAVYFVLVFLGYRYLYSPITAQIQSLETEKQDLEKQVELAIRVEQEKTKSLAGIQQDINEYYDLEQKLPREKQMVEMVDTLGEMAEECNVKLQSISLKATSNQDNTEEQLIDNKQQTTENKVKGVSDLRFMLNVSGRYHQLLEYLMLLEESGRIISVNSITLSMGQKKDQAGSSYEGTYKSVNPPPEVPIPKSAAMGGTSVLGGYQSVSELQMNKYDPDNVQMSIEISAFYDTVSPQLDIPELAIVPVMSGQSSSGDSMLDELKRTMTDSDVEEEQ